MLIEILRRTCIAGRPVLAGELIDAKDHDARYLLAIGKAREAAQPLTPVVITADDEARKPRTRKPRPVF
jgi:hypothetical protein